MGINNINQIVSREEIVLCVKERFKRMDTTSAQILAKKILNGDSTNGVEVREFKTKYKSFIRRNGTLFERNYDEKKDKEYFYLRTDVLNALKKELLQLLEKIGSSIKDLEKEDDKWSKTTIEGEEAYEVTKHTTFQDIREKIDKEGKNVVFRYAFNDADMETKGFKNQLSMQMVDVHVNDNGEYFGFPLKYVYYCPECGAMTERMEHEVASTNERIKCPNIVEKQTAGGDIKFSRCNEPLTPDNNRTETKDSYIHNISFTDEYGVLQKAEAITFMNLPKGHLKVVLQKMPRAYGRHLVHIVDYKPIEKMSFEPPEKNDSEHYIFTLVNALDDYILKQTGYYHYGFLPVKMSMLLQFVARYVPGFKNNFHIALSGSMSSGKSQFSRYWGFTLYSQDCWSSNATSISIPKLRGTMESFRLFNKEYRYQYKGLLGEIDLIIIDEVKEDPDVRDNLKQYALEPTYEYSKQGSNNQTYERTAQLVITQNISTLHLDKYARNVKNVYISEEVGPVNPDDDPKPAWTDNQDLTLPLNVYRNRYLRYAIKRVREMYERNHMNWIDGSELALKQRFFFYYFLDSEKTNEELTRTIRENQMREKITNSINLIRVLSVDKLKERFSDSGNMFKGTNDLEYFEKIDELLNDYNKRTDARTKEMAYSVLKLIRIIDGRDYCTDKDLEIFQFILESIDNKIEVADTNEYKIHGPEPVDDSDIEDNAVNASDDWGYESDLNMFGD